MPEVETAAAAPPLDTSALEARIAELERQVAQLQAVAEALAPAIGGSPGKAIRKALGGKRR